MKYIHARFRVSLDFHVIQRYRRIVLRNKSASCLEQHDSDFCDLPQCSKNLVGLRHLDLDLGLVLLLLVKVLCDVTLRLISIESGKSWILVRYHQIWHNYCSLLDYADDDKFGKFSVATSRPELDARGVYSFPELDDDPVVVRVNL